MRNVTPIRRSSKELVPGQSLVGEEPRGAVSPRPSEPMAAYVSNGTLMARALAAEKCAQDAVDAAARSGTKFAFRRALDACLSAETALKLSGSHTRAGKWAGLAAECREAHDAGDFDRRQMRRDLRLAFVGAVLLATLIGWIVAIACRAQ